MSMSEESRTGDIEETVEQTSGEDLVEIHRPFDPSKIRIRTSYGSLHKVIDRLRHNEINIYTEFQRRDDLWTPTQQSRLIESILLKLPLPAFYFDGSDDNNWDVVDGLQRISTIRNFVIHQNLRLVNLEFLTRFEGATFDDLPHTLQRRIEGFDITMYIIESGTPDDVKYNIFKRINTGGLVLKPQEIRHALNQGRPADFITKLANLEVFKKATDYKIGSERMQDREFANRFVAFDLLGYQDYEPDLGSFLNKGMAAIAQQKEEALQALKGRFEQAMRLAYAIFGADAFRKRQALEDRRKPINKALFDALSVLLGQLHTTQAEALQRNKNAFRQQLMEQMATEDSPFYQAISRSTSSKENVRTRFQTIETLLTKHTE